MLVSGTFLRKLVVVGLGLFIVTGSGIGYAAMTFQQNPPEVQSVNSEWGEVTQNETDVQTTVVVENPNDIGIPGVVGIEYTTKLNDVVIMEGSKSSVGISPGDNEITIPATMENRAIAEWWVTHVNNGESSTLSVQGTLEAPGGVSQPVTSESSTFETEMLGPMQTDQPTTVTLQGEEFIVLKEQSASWGEATMEETPVHFSATVENRHDEALTLDGLGYVIRMNDVTVGEGRTTDGVEVEPGETGTIAVDASIDTELMADWWATHVRNDESTRMSVAMYGLVEQDGELVRVPIELFEKDLRFETNMLEGGGTSVESIEDDEDDGPTYEQPSIVDSEREWGEITEETSEIRTTATLRNPNDGAMNEFVRFSIGHEITINDVTVADGTVDLGTLESGNSTIESTVVWDNTVTPQWWVRHVNNGEQSTRTLERSGTADLGFTTFDVGSGTNNITFESNMLAGLNNDETQELRSNGRKVAEVTQSRAAWGEADLQETPIEVTVTVENTGPVPLSLEDLEYTIMMNDVAAGDGTASESYTIQPGQTRDLTFTVVMDSQKMDEWWVSHLRNDEETSVDVDASVRVTAGGETDRVQLDGMTGSQTVTTDVLYEESEE